MGMDVYGRNPKDETGKYFRNNVWWWHPLATYCLTIAPTITEKCVMWHSNDGDGLDANNSILLAAMLQAEIDSARCAKYEKEHKAHIASLPKKPCSYCQGTGSRTDKIGKENGLDKPGGCNGCGGTGMVEPFEASYPFSVENVQSFVAFLESCGGFEIH